jgi:UDP-glucose 4-epimerase
MSSFDPTILTDTQVLVTGGGGFIGSHLTERLVEIGAQVTVLDDFSAGTRENLTAVRPAIDVIEGDIRDNDVVDSSVIDADYVFHLAANAHVPTSVERPTHDFKINAGGTQALLEGANRTDTERVVIASSAAVYGPPAGVPMDESHRLNPVSPYGASKLAAEQTGLVYNETYDIDVTALRVFNTYGPRQPRYVMYDFIRKLNNDPQTLEVLGSGEEVRTFVYVDDTVDAFLALATVDEAAGEAYNIGGETATRIKDLAELMADRYYDGQPEVYTTGTSKPGDIKKLVADNDKISSLGVDPKTPLEAGLDELYDWYVGTTHSV